MNQASCQPVADELAQRTERSAGVGAAEAATPPAAPYRPAAAAPPWVAAMLDALDYGVLLIDAAQCVVHANRAARSTLAVNPVGLPWAGALACVRPAEIATLAQAIDAAAERGWRRLVTLRREAGPLGVAVVPLPAGGQAVAMLVLSRGRSCEPLSLHWYARSHGLTQAEARVLEALCTGATPHEVAATLGVALSTVRSQLATIRAKTGAAGIRQLVASLASLPPIVCAVEWR
jgi:DNA-binding CsgD family transcriptional regulator